MQAMGDLVPLADSESEQLSLPSDDSACVIASSPEDVAAAASGALVVVDSDDDVPRVQPQSCEVFVAGTLFAEELARMATLEKHRDEFATWDLEKQNAWLFQTLSGMAEESWTLFGVELSGVQQ